MRINRIDLKLGAVIIALFLVVLLSLGFVIDRVFTSFYHTKMRDDVVELAVHFANMAESHKAGSDEMIQSFAEFSDVSIYLIDLSTKQKVSLGKNKVADSTFVRDSDLQLLGKGTNIFYEFISKDKQSYFVSVRPIAGEGTAIYVLSSMKSMEESLHRVRGYLVLSGLGAFFLALGFTYIVSQILSRPLVQMERATRRIAKGDWETRVDVRTSDEIGNLGIAINDLARDLQHYQDTRQEFFANISHELRTPITYLEGYARVLSDELYETEEEKKQYLTIIHQEALRLDHLINDLFELSKIEEGELSLSLDWVDLTDIVRNSVKKVQLKAKEKGLLLSCEAAEQAPLVYADALRMEQVVLNILENAVRYTAKGAIHIRLIKGKNTNQILVEDTGMGIPADELPYIFDRFYRVEKSRSREFGGTGLGLAIVKKLVELQGGTIEAFSRIGVGTRFVITLPTERPAEVGP